jgi:hypothetical protein
MYAIYHNPRGPTLMSSNTRGLALRMKILGSYLGLLCRNPINPEAKPSGASLQSHTLRGFIMAMPYISPTSFDIHHRKLFFPSIPPLGPSRTHAAYSRFDTRLDLHTSRYDEHRKDTREA